MYYVQLYCITYLDKFNELWGQVFKEDDTSKKGEDRGNYFENLINRKQGVF